MMMIHDCGTVDEDLAWLVLALVFFRMHGSVGGSISRVVCAVTVLADTKCASSSASNEVEE